MSNSYNITFSNNELNAIAIALDFLIKDCNTGLAESTATPDSKTQLNKIIQYSTSALAKINAVTK